ncbi:MAG: DUF4880 domain-containing protein, partial [Gammaproteobacteria bacterium]
MSHGPNRTPPQIIDEAAAWLVDMREPVVTEERRALFAEWLRASPAHVGAYLEIAKLWADAAHLGMPGDLANADIGEQNVVPFRADHVPSERPAASQRGRWLRLPVARLAASLLIVTALGALLAWWHLGRSPS